MAAGITGELFLIWRLNCLAGIAGELFWMCLLVEGWRR